MTLNQLRRKKRTNKRRRSKTPALEGMPQKKGICIKVLTKSPKKPNSANRRIAKVRIVETKQTLTLKIQGEQQNLQQHSTLLIQGGRSRDLIGVKYKSVRNKYDLTGVNNRKTSRSRYGVKK
jgi:small subunit ribosomal protein S12